MDSQKPSFRILMFPWLAHGHVFPYLELSKRMLARKNFHIYFCSTAVNFSSIRSFIQRNLLEHSIEIVELRLQPSHELPPHYHTTKNLPSNLVRTLIEAFQTASICFWDIIATLKPDLVIYDSFEPWAATIASSEGIPAIHFVPIGAATRSFVHHHYVCRNDNFPIPELGLQGDEKKDMDNLIEFLRANVFEQDKDVFFVNVRLSCDIFLLKSGKGLEGKYIDYLSAVCQKKLLPVGPLVTESYGENDEEESEVLQWLIRKEHHSVVYISFGSERFLSKEEIGKIAKALELCGVSFIWVIRFPLGEKTFTIEEALPQGFLDKVQARGMVVSGWAPQANILAHPSTGAFVSHCGWSSANESIYFGVPIIGMPKKLNMFIDAKMLAEAGACVEVPRKENEVFKGEEIAKVIKKVVMEKSGEGLRHRAQELGEKMRMEEGQAIDEAAEHLWQICLKNKIMKAQKGSMD